VAVKKLLFIIILSTSSIAKSETIYVDYWNGLVYDFANANAYQIKQPIINDFEVGVVAISSQLYWDCNGCYTVIPQHYAASIGKSFVLNNLQINVSTNYWTTKSIIFPNKYNFELGLNYQFKEYSVIQFKHYTNSNNIHNLYNISFEHRF